MHGPTGFLGVQDAPYKRQALGLILPKTTLAQSQPGGMVPAFLRAPHSVRVPQGRGEICARNGIQSAGFSRNRNLTGDRNRRELPLSRHGDYE